MIRVEILSLECGLGDSDFISISASRIFYCGLVTVADRHGTDGLSRFLNLKPQLSNDRVSSRARSVSVTVA
jgi:hypothetical protein